MHFKVKEVTAKKLVLKFEIIEIGYATCSCWSGAFDFSDV